MAMLNNQMVSDVFFRMFDYGFSRHVDTWMTWIGKEAGLGCPGATTWSHHPPINIDR